MAANAAIAMARLGAPVHLLGRVGDDSAGDFVRSQVQAHKVHAHLEPVVQAHTSVSSVIVDANGERLIFNHRGDVIAKAHAVDTQQLEGAQALLTDPRWCEGALAALLCTPAQPRGRIAPCADQRRASSHGDFRRARRAVV